MIDLDTLTAATAKDAPATAIPIGAVWLERLIFEALIAELRASRKVVEAAKAMIAEEWDDADDTPLEAAFRAALTELEVQK